MTRMKRRPMPKCVRQQKRTDWEERRRFQKAEEIERSLRDAIYCVVHGNQQFEARLINNLQQLYQMDLGILSKDLVEQFRSFIESMLQREDDDWVSLPSWNDPQWNDQFSRRADFLRTMAEVAPRHFKRTFEEGAHYYETLYLKSVA